MAIPMDFAKALNIAFFCFGGGGIDEYLSDLGLGGRHDTLIRSSVSDQMVRERVRIRIGIVRTRFGQLPSRSTSAACSNAGDQLRGIDDVVVPDMNGSRGLWRLFRELNGPGVAADRILIDESLAAAQGNGRAAVVGVVNDIVVNDGPFGSRIIRIRIIAWVTGGFGTGRVFSAVGIDGVGHGVVFHGVVPEYVTRATVRGDRVSAAFEEAVFDEGGALGAVRFSRMNGSIDGNPIAIVADAGFVYIPKCTIVDYAPGLAPNHDAAISRETEGALIHAKVRYIRKRNADLSVFEAGGLPTRDPKRRKTNRTGGFRAEERGSVLGERGDVGVGGRGISMQSGFIHPRANDGDGVLREIDAPHDLPFARGDHDHGR